MSYNANSAVSEDEILSNMPEGRLWLGELLRGIELNPSMTGHLINERAAANVVANLAPEQQAALAAIFIQREVARVLHIRPGDARRS